MKAPVSLATARSLLEEFTGLKFDKDVDLSLEDAWYETGEKDFSLYGREEYLPYLLKAHGESRSHAQLAAEFLLGREKLPDNILDTGCGLGLYSLYLAEMFPESQVYATNLPGRQFEFNTWLFKKSGLKNLHLRVPDEVTGEFDAVLALEYFEHYQKPEEALTELMDRHRPKCLIESSSFSHRGLGHFSSYTFADGEYAGRGDQKGACAAYKKFTKCLTGVGYKREPLYHGTWHFGRPRIWSLDINHVPAKAPPPIHVEEDFLSKFFGTPPEDLK